MRIGSLMHADFVLLDGARTAAEALERLARAGDSTSVVVELRGGACWLLDGVEARRVLMAAQPAAELAGLAQAGALDGFKVPLLDIDLPADGAPDRCVVTEQGLVAGVFDATRPTATPALGRPLAVRGTCRQPGVSGGGSAPAEAPDTWYLETRFPEQLALDETRSLLVSVSLAGDNPRALPLALTPGSTLDLVVQPIQGLEIQGAAEAQLTIADDEPLPVQFRLKATAPGLAKLRVFVFKDGQALGALSLTSLVGEADHGQRPAQANQLRLDTPAPSNPDLTLLILEHTHQGKPAFTLRLNAQDPGLGLNFKPFGPIVLEADPPGTFKTFFEDIEGLSVATAQDRANTMRRLAQRGSWLYESLIPEDLRTLLWSLRERIRTVQIQSEEPWIPWEMCKLGAQEGGRFVEGPFLCQAFDLTRWMPGIRRVGSFGLQNVAVVAPADSGLPVARTEQAYLMSMAGAQRKVQTVRAQYLDVIDALHFTGHGLFRDGDPNRSGIVLEGGEELRPTDLSGRTRNLGTRSPLVFLNACQTGRSDIGLCDIGGWAAQFLRAGAGAFIGTYWSVYDDGALDFARSFYDGLLAGRTVGASARLARQAVEAQGDPSFLAYTVFAEPDACVRPAGGH